MVILYAHNLRFNKFEGDEATVSCTLSSPSNRMSPFADKPELWLTGHLQRQIEEEKAVKIQAAFKGFLQRRKSLKDSIAILVKRLEPSKNPMTVQQFMRKHGLATWAEMCPSKEAALMNLDKNKERQDAIWHAKNTLRLMGNTELITELEWCDYHEESKALVTLSYGKPQEESVWTKLTKLILG